MDVGRVARLFVAHLSTTFACTRSITCSATKQIGQMDRAWNGRNSSLKISGTGSRASSTKSYSDLTAVERQYAAPGPETPRRIHILGLGSIGKLVAHALRGIPDAPPVTLIVHRHRWLEQWEESDKEITIKIGDTEVKRGGYDVELLPENYRAHGVEKQTGGDPYEYEGFRPHEAAQVLKNLLQERIDDGEEIVFDPETPQVARPEARLRTESRGISLDPIHNLIVTTKAALTVPALLPLRHRLSSESTICFLQNGMGIIDDVNKHVFPVVADRPNYIQGVVTHGVNVPRAVAERNPFWAIHAGHGTIALGLLARDDVKNGEKETTTATSTDEDLDSAASSARYLLRTITRTPVLGAIGFTPTELLQLQLEKLAVNSVINPLTTLLDVRNGDIRDNYALTRTLRLLLAETSQIIRSLPELQSIPNLELRFGPDRLEKLVFNVADKTANNISSMLSDVRAGRKTEVEFINGYIVRRGEELGISAVVNYAIMQTVIGKAQITQREAQNVVPMAGEPLRRWT